MDTHTQTNNYNAQGKYIIIWCWGNKLGLWKLVKRNDLFELLQVPACNHRVTAMPARLGKKEKLALFFCCFCELWVNYWTVLALPHMPNDEGQITQKVESTHTYYLTHKFDSFRVKAKTQCSFFILKVQLITSSRAYWCEMEQKICVSFYLRLDKNINVLSYDYVQPNLPKLAF